MIVGIGTDICSIERVRSLLDKSGEKFVRRILCEAEIEKVGGIDSILKNGDAYLLAKRFAAKEAISKALGCGIGEQLSFTDIEIFRKKEERPQVKIHNQKFSKLKIQLSISDEKEYAVAFAIAEEK